MPLTYVTGDPLLTEAKTLAFGYNARARSEVSPLATELLNRHPAAFATFRKQCSGGRIKPGMIWHWSESQPSLLFLVVRESSVGSTRLRFVEQALMTIARDYLLYNLSSIGLAPLGGQEETGWLQPLVDYWLASCPLPISVYRPAGT